MKFNNITPKIQRAALFAMMPMMLVACKSRDRQIKELDGRIQDTQIAIEETYKARQQALDDSVSRNAMLTVLHEWIDADAAKIDSLRNRNQALVDSIQERSTSRLARKYPLSAFISNKELKIISGQLREFHNEWNETAAANIMAGRGTLMDLYSVAYDLDYTLFEPSFYIINDDGDLRFDNERLNKKCREFESEKEELLNDEILTTMRHSSNKKEYAVNQSQIDEHDRLCNISDSVYMEIESHFYNKYATPIKKLNAYKSELEQKRNILARERAEQRRR